MTSRIRLGSPRSGLVAGLAIALLAAVLPGPVLAAPTSVAFHTQPAGPAGGGSAFPTQPVVHVEDGGGPLADQPVTIAIKSGTGAPGATLTCTGGLARTTGPGGDAGYTGCSIDRKGTGYVLVATAGALRAQSSAFDVVAGPAHHLVFANYPSAASATLLSPQPAIGVVDAGGNFALDYRPVTLGIDAKADTFRCTGELTRPLFQGLVTFQGCQQSTVGMNYHLTADDGPGGLAPITGPGFDVTNAPAAKVLLCWGPADPCNTAPPTGLTGGVVLPVQPVVRVTDADGHLVVRDSSTVVTLAVAPGTPANGGPGGLQCQGGLTQTVTNGGLYFNGCRLNDAGSGYRLLASAPSLAPATSNPFTVNSGPPVKLGFRSAPTEVAVNAPFTVQVAIQDAGGNTVTSGIESSITIALGSNPGATAFLCDAKTVATVNGLATFTNCTVNQRASGFTIIASAGGTAPPVPLPAVETAPFRVVDQLAQLTLATSRSVVTWGETAFLALALAAKGANRPVRVEASADQQVWGTVATGTTDAAGHATVPITPDRNRYYRAIFAGASDLGAGTSNVVRVVVRQIALLRPTHGSRVARVTVGDLISLATTVRPARADLPRAKVRYVVYRLSGNAWRLAATHDVTIDASGRAAIEIQLGVGRWYVRSMALPTAANANSAWSPVEWYEVVPLTAT